MAEASTLSGDLICVTEAKTDFRVAIDTGSTDLWIAPPADFQFTAAGIPVQVTYAGGQVKGTIGFADMQLEGYEVVNQGSHFFC
jgi:hypothetical protein